MPDPPDKGRPSSAPLSVEDADRLADTFTAFWEDAGAPDASGPVAAVAAPSPATVSEGTVTAPMPAVAAPMPAVAAVRKPIGKQTLVGIAPAIERPSSAPGATPVPAAVALTQPLPAVAPVAAGAALEPPSELPVASALPHKKTLVGFAIPNDPAPPVASVRPSAPPSAVQQSTPDVPGYAIAYTPKDPPSTPAVVIAPEAQSSPENKPPEAKRQFSQTVPSRIRSAPNSSIAPLPPPAAVDDDFNPYVERKGKGKVIGWALAGVILLLAGVLGVRTLSEQIAEPAPQAAPHTDVVQAAPAVPPAPTPAPAQSAATEEAIPTPANRTASAAEPAAPSLRRTSEAPPAKAKAKAKAEPGTASTRSVTRAPAPIPAEPSPSPSKPVSRGVIVRDAPF